MAIDSENELRSEIEKWTTFFSSQASYDKRLLELAFFKIVVKFEKFLSELFVIYSTGGQSPREYVPSRKLEFIDEKHLSGVIAGNKPFINYYQTIQQISKHVFIDNQDPFSLIFDDLKYSGYLQKMKHIRNYIAHESIESKHSYKTKVLNGKFVEPYIHLQEMDHTQKISLYTVYINSLLEIVDILIEPQKYL